MYSIILNGKDSVIRETLLEPINTSQGSWFVGLIGFEVFNSIPNLTDSFIKFGGQVINIPTGCYEIKQLNSFLKKEIDSLVPKKTRNFSLIGNMNTLKAEIKASEGVELEASLATLLGFSNTKLQEKIKIISDLPCNIQPVSSIRVDLNFCSGAFINNKRTHVVHELSISVEPGYKILEHPHMIVFHPINVDSIQDIEVRLVDQNNHLINFRNELITIRLILKKDI